ncbi:poly-gamma-glutamate synthesis protein (capsule biosynthesis protein) [Actinomadura pelletieri DSM 43383]|uniref:Poly-gamma-glutamate synthesis protein (Capsule biosynthesis protein) n=1 Tax=Actinomadura pelletieri DSM 43383 TaxID=1120940 RepID=A0A495QN55_9ACTN|nr:CapA family protein [Actinomadura pelletieri]RKS74418.1 poly-gamma-glutamate synthesis protein (capsule biosynthesis protein) [Actinomadura pelletieri DSM 43383]
MAVTMALAGDTMLGRGVAEEIAAFGPRGLFSRGVRDVFAEADLAVLNLECCVSVRGRRWEAPGKPFHFRAPPVAVEALTDLGVDCVTLANNHALDYGPDALDDTLDHLDRAGVRSVGAGPDEEAARRSVVLEAGGVRVAVVGVTDHPSDFAAGPGRPGVAFVELERGVPDDLVERVRRLRAGNDVVLVLPHWGPNMTWEPLRHVRRAARTLLDAGATLVAGSSAHVFHGVAWPVIFDMGDFIDDYAVDEVLRNDLGLLFLVTLDRAGPSRIEAVPLRLDHCHTRLAEGADHRWIAERFTRACAAFGTNVDARGDRLVIDAPV